MEDIAGSMVYYHVLSRSWQLTQAARLIFSSCHPSTLVIFLQTDISSAGRWIDKAALLCREAEALNVSLLWHKITFEPAAVAASRRGAAADYGHLLCFLTAPHRENYACLLPDLLVRGKKIYAQGMGVEVMKEVLTWLRKAQPCLELVVDPFCGRGTILALANQLGLEALGVDLDANCARAARRLDLEKLEKSTTVQPVAFYLRRAALSAAEGPKKGAWEAFRAPIWQARRHSGAPCCSSHLAIRVQSCVLLKGPCSGSTQRPWRL